MKGLFFLLLSARRHDRFTKIIRINDKINIHMRILCDYILLICKPQSSTNGIFDIQQLKKNLLESGNDLRASDRNNLNSILFGIRNIRKFSTNFLKSFQWFSRRWDLDKACSFDLFSFSGISIRLHQFFIVSFYLSLHKCCFPLCLSVFCSFHCNIEFLWIR